MAVIVALLAFFAFGLVQWILVRLIGYVLLELVGVESGLLRFVHLNLVLMILTGPLFWMWDILKPVAGLWWLAAAVWTGGGVLGHRLIGRVIG